MAAGFCRTLHRASDRKKVTSFSSTHWTERNSVDAVAPQPEGHRPNGVVYHLYAVQAAVAAQSMLEAGRALVHLVWVESTEPSLPMHSTRRCSEVAGWPQAEGQASKAEALHANATQGAVGAQAELVAGLVPAALQSASAPVVPLE